MSAFDEMRDYEGHAQEFEADSVIVHWYITAQVFLAQLNATVRPWSWETREKPFLEHASNNCRDCDNGFRAVASVRQ